MTALPPDQRAADAPDLPSSAFGFIWHFVSKYRWLYLAMALLEAINATCGILIPYALGQITRGVASATEQTTAVMEALRAPLLLFVALSVGEVIFGRLAGAIQIRLGPRQRQNVTRSIYHYLQHHSHRFISNNFAGSLAHRISEASMGVTMTLWLVLVDFLPIAIVFSVSTALLLRTHLHLGGFVAIWAIGFVTLSYLLARRCQPYAFTAASARSETTGKVVDSVSNLTSVKLFARLDYERSYLEKYLGGEMRAIRKSNGFAERIRWFQFSAAAVLKVGVLYYALTLWGRGEIGVGDFVMAVSLSLLVLTEARNLSRRFLELFEYVGNVSNAVHTIVQPHELVDAPQARKVTLQAGEIEFRDVTFAYMHGKPVFEHLDVRIPAGQRVGLVGLSGSGKSTFTSLILRLFDAQSGTVSIDGHDIRALPQNVLHSQLSLIPQDPSLFHRTLRENIRYGRIEASDAEVEEAARKAHAHDFIVQAPDGYDALVGERGVKLSGGQRQRIAIARVILKNAPVLILDEATSSLDTLTEMAIQQTLDEVMVGKTVLVVAHRLSTVAQLDRILVFHQGRIVEDGPHAELLRQGGMYHQLWSRQTDPAETDTPPSPQLVPA